MEQMSAGSGCWQPGWKRTSRWGSLGLNYNSSDRKSPHAVKAVRANHASFYFPFSLFP